ncbi:TPA: hypothetical protein ACFB2A_001603, partial [Neisseria gonorrhoeae]
ALPLLIRRFRCRLNLQTAFLMRPPFTGAGRVRGNTRTVIPDNTAISKPVIPDNTAISKPVIPAQAGIRTPDAAGIYRK